MKAKARTIQEELIAVIQEASMKVSSNAGNGTLLNRVDLYAGKYPQLTGILMKDKGACTGITYEYERNILTLAPKTKEALETLQEAITVIRHLAVASWGVSLREASTTLTKAQDEVALVYCHKLFPEHF